MLQHYASIPPPASVHSYLSIAPHYPVCRWDHLPPGLCGFPHCDDCSSFFIPAHSFYMATLERTRMGITRSPKFLSPGQLSCPVLSDPSFRSSQRVWVKPKHCRVMSECVRGDSGDICSVLIPPPPASKDLNLPTYISCHEHMNEDLLSRENVHQQV